ncbi:hypothetical protein [Fluviicola sp.]|uniref:hypothetical protein n=1 Tax=Fluviicola sp. TaxID=1917219 RepID=UPI0031DCF611
MNQQETVSVEKALKKGRSTITVPASVGSKAILGIFILFSVFKVIPWQVTLYAIPVVLLVFPWVYKSRMITKWKLWAYEYCANVHELKAKAIMQGIITETPGFLEEWFQNSAEKQQLKILQQKFAVPDRFIDRPDVPPETIFYFPRKKHLLPITLLGIASVISAIAFCLTGRVVSLIIPAITVCFILFVVFRRREDIIYLVLTEKGMEGFELPFTSWAVISRERIIRGEGEDSDYFYWVFDGPDGEKRVCIDTIEMKPADFYDLVKIYRGRFEKQREEL